MRYLRGIALRRILVNSASQSGGDVQSICPKKHTSPDQEQQPAGWTRQREPNLDSLPPLPLLQVRNAWLVRAIRAKH